MTRSWLVLVLLTLGCAGGRELRQATMPAPAPPPRPTYTPHGAGLPGERMPDAVRPSVPRSPNRRVLPASDEPGLWAADGPRASNEPFTKVLDVTLPIPATVEKNVDRLPARACVMQLGVSIDRFGLRDEVKALTPGERACFVAEMYRQCLAEQNAAYPKASSMAKFVQDAADVATSFRREKCHGGTETKLVKQLLIRMKDRWRVDGPGRRGGSHGQ